MTRKTMQKRFRSLALERRVDPDSDQKLAELILYISSMSEDDPFCGATKLNKILYFADAISFAEYGEPITGAQYMKEEFGPVPVRLVPVREKLKETNAIAVQKRSFLQGSMHRIVALRDPNLDVLSSRDIALTVRVIKALRHRDTKSVSDMTHSRKPWQLARLGETIPYSAILLSSTGVTEEDTLEAQDLIKKYGWDDV